MANNASHQIDAILKQLRRNVVLGMVSTPAEVQVLLKLYDRVLERLLKLKAKGVDVEN